MASCDWYVPGRPRRGLLRWREMRKHNLALLKHVRTLASVDYLSGIQTETTDGTSSR